MQRAQETAAPIAEKLGVEPVTDDRLIEAANAFEGQYVGVGDGALRRPEFWPLLRNPFRPSWGEPYLEIAHRMLGAAHRARAAAAGHEAVCVSPPAPDLDVAAASSPGSGSGTTRRAPVRASAR